MSDHYSKFTKLRLLRKATTKTNIDRIVHNYIPELGKPHVIITDYGTQFKAKVSFCVIPLLEFIFSVAFLLYVNYLIDINLCVFFFSQYRIFVILLHF